MGFSPSRPAHTSALRTAAVAVLGGGITGLTAAWHLQRAGVPVTVFEAGGEPGGAIVSVQQDGWLHEEGPNTVSDASPETAEMLDLLGLGPRRLYAAETAKNRYIVRDGRLAAMPRSPMALLRGGLFSRGTVLNVLAEPFRKRAPADVEETVAEFAARRLGRELFEYAVDPFVSGICAGDPRRLSVRHAFPKFYAMEREHGSLIRGAFNRHRAPLEGRSRIAGSSLQRGIFSFPEGLAELPRALALSLGESVRLRHPVLAVSRGGAGWEISFGTDRGAQHEIFSAVICALPAEALARMPFEGVPEAHRLAALGEIQQPPLVSVFTGYRREDIAHPLDGFGLLAPAVEKRRILGALFSSTLFPGRAPANHAALTTLVGGRRQPELAQLEDGALLRLVQEELTLLLGLRGAPVFTHLKRWPRSIPQYELGYGRFLDACAAVEASSPGLFIGGNFRDGLSLANCIEAGRRLEEHARRQS